MHTEDMWRATEARDASLAGAFIIGVKTTGIYCRPGCPSRIPKRKNVDFYPSPEAARLAGFRACKRCDPDATTPSDPHVETARRVCALIEAALDDGLEGAPGLSALGAATGVSPHHLQKSFKRVMGVSPQAYVDALRLARLKDRLKAGEDVTGAVYEAGYGASSRVYERAPGELGMTPATYAKGGAGAEMTFTVQPSALGLLMVAATGRGISFIALGDDVSALEAELRAEFPEAAIVRDDAVLGAWTDAVVAHLAGHMPHLDLPLDVRATAFQRRVWEELMRIPAGETRTYSEIAERLGLARGQRAVGRACATNPVSIAIPCHRAIRVDGGLGGYRWGLHRKRKLLDDEKARTA